MNLIELSRWLLPALLSVLPTPPAGAPASGQDAGATQERVAELQSRIAALQQELEALGAGATAEDLAAEQSVKPGINRSWKSENITPLIERLEAESREIYVHADLLAAVAGPRPGMVVADVGAGSGFMAQLFAALVGDQGKVYAVDINATMMERLAAAAAEQGLENLETVVCTERSVELPPASVDLVFVCDTYHHFEYPRNTLSTIHRALKPGGQLVVVDFHRIEGVSPQWILGHVRDGEEVFTREIEAAGFELINTHYLPQLEENYALRFVRR